MLKKLKRWLMTDENREKFDLEEAKKSREKSRENTIEDTPTLDTDAESHETTQGFPSTDDVDTPKKQRVVKRVIKRVENTPKEEETASPQANSTDSDELHERLRNVQEQRKLRKNGVIHSEDAASPVGDDTSPPIEKPSLDSIVAMASANLDDTSDSLILARKKQEEQEKKLAMYRKKQEEREHYENIFLDLPPTNDLDKLISTALSKGVAEWYLLEAGYIDVAIPETLKVENDYVEVLEKNIEESVENLTEVITQEIDNIASSELDEHEKEIAYQVAAETVKETFAEKARVAKEELDVLEKEIPVQTVPISSTETALPPVQITEIPDTVAISNDDLFTYDLSSMQEKNPEEKPIIAEESYDFEKVGQDTPDEETTVIVASDELEETVSISEPTVVEVQEPAAQKEDDAVSLRIAQLRATMNAYQTAQANIDAVVESRQDDIESSKEPIVSEQENPETPSTNEISAEIVPPTSTDIKPTDFNLESDVRTDIADKIRKNLSKRASEFANKTVETAIAKSTALDNFGTVTREVLSIFTIDEIFVKESITTADSVIHTNYCRYKLLNIDTDALNIGDIVPSDTQLELVRPVDTIIDGEFYNLTAAEERLLETREVWLLSTDEELFTSAKEALKDTRYILNVPRTERDFLLAIRNTSNLLIFTQKLPQEIKTSITKYIQYLGREKKRARITTLSTSIVKAGIIEKTLVDISESTLDAYYEEYPKSLYHKNNKELADIYKGISFDISSSTASVLVTDEGGYEDTPTGFEALDTLDGKILVDFSTKTTHDHDIPPTLDLSVQDAIQIEDDNDSLY